MLEPGFPNTAAVWLMSIKWARSRARLFVLLLVFFMIPAAGSAAEDIGVGPLFSRFKLTLEEGEREESFGPLFYEQTAPEREMIAMPPLWSREKNPEVDSLELDFLYPVLTYDRFGSEHRFQIGQWLSFSGGKVSQNETNFSQFTFFPFYFQQRSAVPEKNYTAFWPLYGQVKNRLFRDEIDFVLWPAYVKTKRLARSAPPLAENELVRPIYHFFGSRRGDVTTYNFLAPIFHVRTGAGLKGWQVWPLAGAEHREPLRWTNRWDDVSVEGGHEKFFALWPIYAQNKTGIGTTNEEHQTLMLPLFSTLKSPLRDSTTAPWPIGITFTVDRGRQYREWGAPWPFVVFARGEGKTTSRVWPFFSEAHSASLESGFYLWPLYKYNRIHAPPLDRDRTRILLFLYSDAIEKNTETGKIRRRVDAWPLFTYKRDWEGNERWQTLSILEPVLPASKSIERNYSQLWSVVRAERNAATGNSSESLFWNLYRHESDLTNRHSSLLFGLVKWDVGPEGRTSRWFYLPAKVAY
jgi:hypothetical protein